MDKDTVKGWIGCLTPIIAISIYVVSYRSCQESKVEKYFYVEQTGYFHSTKDEDECRFIKSAKKDDYTIKMINYSEAICYNYKICKECYTKEQQATFYKEVARYKEISKRSKEYNAWRNLYNEQDADYDKLQVYIDTSNVLHIDGNCIFNKLEMKRIPLNEVESINNTCEDCVERWVVDFLYKSVYEKVYDKSVIKYPDTEYDEEYMPEIDR